MPLWHAPLPQVAPAIGASPTTGLSPGITYASPNNPFYSLSGSAPVVIPSNLVVSTLTAVSETVSGFINLDGNILTTASGVGAELLLNGIPIATTSNLSSIQDWAKFPAVSTVNANSNLITNISSLVGIPGGTLPILASNVEFGGLGQLTGISTINGAPPGSGNAANWATYSAVQDVNMNSCNLNSANQVNLNTGGNVVMLTAGTGNNLLVNGTPVSGGGGTPSTIAGLNTFMTATGTSGTATSAISAGGGLGGFITATANPGAGGISGGNITLTANGGTAPAGLYGQIDIIANEGVSDPGTGAITTGGYVNIVANSGGALGNLTSRIDLNAGGLNLYAGITTPITSVFGYGFINALTGLSLVAGTFSSAFQVPGTVYLYGLSGIVLGSDTYATKIYPYWNGLTAPPNLEINGRTTISGNAYVALSNVSTISFDATAGGAITGVQSINGSVYPPPAGSIPPNINFSTIGVGTGGSIIFSDATGYIETNAIYGRGGDDLFLDAPTGFNLTLNGGSPPASVPQSRVSLQPDGSLIINNDTGSIPITNGAGLIISPEGQRITFPKDAATGLLDIGEIVGLSTINGSAYVPGGGGSYPPNPSFSTITIGAAGTVIFSDSAGYIETGGIYALFGGDLVVSASTGNNMFLSGGSPGGGVSQSLVSLLPNGTTVINNDNSATVPITDGTGLIVSTEGYNLTFPLDPTSTTGVGSINNLAEINGLPYPPPLPVSVASLNTLSGGLTLTATEGTVVITPGTTDINLYVPSAPYTLSGTTAGAVIVNRPIGSGNPFPSNTFTNATQITFNIPPGWTATDSVSYDGFAFFDFSANFNSFWGISYFTNTVATPTDILGSTTTTANALTYSNIQQIYIPINLIIPPTNLSAGGTITLTFFCSPTSINHYITVAPTNTAKIGVVRD